MELFFLSFCVPELHAQHKNKYSYTLELLSQHKTSINHVLQSSSLNTKHLINHVLQGPCPNTKHFIHHVLQGLCPTQPTYTYIYIIINWLIPNIQNKSSCSCAVGSLTQYKINHQYSHLDQQAHAYKWQVQNSGYYNFYVRTNFSSFF